MLPRKLGLDLELSLSSGAGVPVMAVLGNSNVISNGDATPSAGDFTQFATKNAADNSDRTFTISNATGAAPLTGVNVLAPSGYTLVTPPSATIAAGGSSNFVVRCNSSTPGSAAGNITIESNELADYVFAVACTVRTYLEKLQTLGFNQLLALSETSGINAADSSGNSLAGTYSGVTLNQGTFTDGTPYATWDGVNDYVNAFSAGLASAFSLSAGTLSAWVQMPAANWEDSTNYWIAMLFIDANNRVSLIKSNAARTITVQHIASGVVKTVSYVIPATPTGFVRIASTWDGTLRLYYQGAPVGTPVAQGDMVGTLTESRIGSYIGALFLPGNIKYPSYKNLAMSSGDAAIAAVVP